MNIRASNNFDFLRFSAASLVLFSHSFPLIDGNGKNEPLVFITNGSVSIGKISVIIFFIISGFLISASWENRKNFSTFITARIKRIFPGLAVMLLLTVLCGAFLTNMGLANYFQSALPYFFLNFILKGRVAMADIFSTNPYTSSVNGSLWTLRFEFTCYLIVALLGVLGRFNRTWVWVVWGGAVILSPMTSIPTAFLSKLFPFIAWFSAGILAYLYRDYSWQNKYWLILLVVTLVFWFYQINLIYISPMIAYLLIRVAYMNSPLVNFGKHGDFSYGIYIYAFPIQQFVVYLMTKSILQPMEWWMCFLVAFPITLLCSIASWHLVEKKFLKLNKRK